jgi:signal transduction histidine kinase
MKQAIIAFLLLCTISCHNRQGTHKGISPADSGILARLSRATDDIKYADPDSALRLQSQIRAIHNRLHNDKGLIKFYTTAAHIYCELKSDTATGRKYLDSAWRLSGVKGNENLRYIAHAGYGDYYLYTMDYRNAAGQHLKALKAHTPVTDSGFLLNTHGTLAQIFSYQNNFEEASRYYEPMIRYAERQPGSAQEIIIFINGYCFANKENDAGRARARKYIYAAKSLAEKIQDSSTANILYTNLAFYYRDAGQIDSSAYFAQKAIHSIEAGQSLGDPFAPFEIIAQYYIDQGNFTKAKLALQQLERLANTYGFREIKFEAQYYDLKYQVLKQEGNTKAALAALERRTKLDEQIAELAKAEQLLDHEKELKKLAADKIIAAKNHQIERQKLYTIGLIAFSLLLAILAVAIYMHWRDKKLRETEKWQIIQKRKAYENQRKLYEERSRIARDMHDDLGSTLTSTLMAVELVKQQPGNPALLDMIDRSANKLCDQINEIIWNMNIRNDNLESLCDYILHFARPFLSEAGIALSFKEDIREEHVTVQGYQRRSIYLSVKEVIHNVVKHAGATALEFAIAYQDGILDITISDNGQGITEGKTGSSRSGQGLDNIKRNITGLNGQVNWQSSEQGTQVHISVPI